MPRRRRTDGRTDSSSVTARKLCSCFNYYQSSPISDELHGKSEINRVMLPEDGTSTRCVFRYFWSSCNSLFITLISVTLLSSGPEVQYVALRNILLIIQRRPAVLKNDVKVFFCKYNDPIYVKLAKLEIMYRLARAENANEVLTELQESVHIYA